MSVGVSEFVDSGDLTEALKSVIPTTSIVLRRREWTFVTAGYRILSAPPIVRIFRKL